MPTTLCEITHSMTPRVDREAGVIRGVKVLGRQSKNGREYSDKAIREAAKFYEGLNVNIDHPSRDKAGAERSVRDVVGWLSDARIETDGVYADMHYLKDEPVSAKIAEAASRNPMTIGLSHNAEGTVVKVNGKNVVESIQGVRSVDVVQTPATVNGLFEATDSKSHPSKTCRQILEDYTGSSLPPVPGMEDESEPAEMAAPAGPDEDPQREAKAALTQVFSAALMAGGDLKSILAQVVALATAMMGSMPDPADAAAAGEEGDEVEDGEALDPADDTEDPAAAAGDTQSSNGQPPEEDDPMQQKRKNPMAESAATKADPTKELLEAVRSELAELKAERARAAIAGLLESNNVEPLASRVAAVLAVTDEAQRKELIESFPQRERISHRGPRPAVRTALQESQGGDTKYPSDLRSFVSAIKRG